MAFEPRENASIFSRRCSPLHASLGQRATQGHTGGPRRVFSDAHVPGKNRFQFIFPPRGGKTLLQGYWTMPDTLTVLHGNKVC